MSDFIIYETDRIEFDAAPDGIRLTQTVGGEESVIWIANSQLAEVIDILQSVLDGGRE